MDEAELLDSDNGEDIEFKNIDRDHNKYSIKFNYDMFAALTPKSVPAAEAGLMQ